MDTEAVRFGVGVGDTARRLRANEAAVGAYSPEEGDATTAGEARAGVALGVLGRDIGPDIRGLVVRKVLDVTD